MRSRVVNLEAIRQNTLCEHKCPCGVEMIGNEPDLEAWLLQHLTLSNIHRNWQLEVEMERLEIQIMLEGD